MQSEEKERKVQEQILTQAITEELVPKIGIQHESNDEIILSAPSLLTEPLDILHTATPTSSGFSSAQTLDTRPSGNISKTQLTGNMYFEFTQPDEEKIALETFSPVKENKRTAKNDTKMFWLLPMTALGILTVSGIGGIMWLNSADSTNSNKSAANSATKVVVPNPTVSPSLSPTILPTVSPTSIPSTPPTSLPTREKSDKAKEKPKTPVLPIPDVKMPVQIPVKTPTAQKTPKIKTSPNLSDDCIYNGKC